MKQGRLLDAQIEDLSTKLPLARRAVVWAGDQNFLPLIEASITTFTKSLNLGLFQDNLAVCLFHDGIGTESLNLLEKSLNLPDQLQFCDLELPKNFPAIDPESAWPTLAYARLLIPSVFAQFETVLYLDGDTWILDDLSPILLNPLPDGNSLGAVPDLVMAKHVLEKSPTPKKTKTLSADRYLSEKLEIQSVNDYFNSGVLVFHPSQMSPETFNEHWLENIRHNHYWFPDQDILNTYAKGQFARLDGEWNYLSQSTWPKSPTNQSIKILHLAGKTRPWRIHMGKFYQNYHQFVRGSAARHGVTKAYVTGPVLKIIRTILVFVFRMSPASLRRLARKVMRPQK